MYTPNPSRESRPYPPPIHVFTDLSPGQYLYQPATACWNLCSGSPVMSDPEAGAGSTCCDAAATCACGTHTGNYQCLCPAGHFGRGTVGDCTRE